MLFRSIVLVNVFFYDFSPGIVRPLQLLLLSRVKGVERVCHL